jgi:hypothetical protein
MRVTGIRYNEKNGSGKPTERFLDDICEMIVGMTNSRGFITEAQRLTGTALKIGLHMRSFRIDVNKVGHNARISRYVDSPKGYKRTDVPTWDQRVEFNNIVNKIFDKFGLEANIKSGCFTIRDKVKGAHTESDWEDQTPSWMGTEGHIMTEKEAREECNSDQLEREHKEKTRDERLKKARAYRAKMRVFENETHVIVSGFFRWDGKPTKNGKRMSKDAFYKMLGKLDHWTKRKVKQATIENTVNQKEIGF